MKMYDLLQTYEENFEPRFFISIRDYLINTKNNYYKKI